MYADSSGLMPAAGQDQPTGPAGSRRPGVVWPVVSGPVPPLAESFTARPDTVPGLETVLVPGAAVALVPSQEAAGRGWPGACGKTQLASYLAGSLQRSRTVDLTAWVTATSRASVLSGYVRAAGEVGLEHGEDAESVAARFAAWLGGTARPWLVVLDDLRDAADLDGLWPAGPAGRLLITTADPVTACGGRRVRAMPVPAFSPREAVSCLLGRLTTDPDQRSGAIDLAADLGGQPAAVAQAGAVIASSGLPSRQYRHLFARRRAQLAADGTGPSCAAAVTWTLAAEHAGQLAPGAGCWLLLVLCAVRDGDGIPGTVLITAPVCQYLGDGAARPPDPRQAWTAVLALERAGLLAIGRAGTPPAVWVSPALQAAVRAAVPPEVLDRAAQAAADALVEAWPAGQPRSWLAVSFRSCAASVHRAAGDLLWAGAGCPRLLLLTGHSLDDAGLTGPAVSWWRELAADCRRILGQDHPDSLVTGGLLAGALLVAGQAAEAVTWSRWVLAGRTGVLGPDHPATIAAQVSLGRALIATGQPGEAGPVLEQAARHCERVHGPHDAGTLAAWDQYAAACLAAGNAAEAIRCYQRSLAGRERLHGPDHPATLTTRLLLADACLTAGKIKDAIAGCKRALSSRERALGADHPDTLAARASLAAAYDAAGQMGAALRQHQEACAGYERAFGADHPGTLARHADLAHAYHAAGQLGDAVSLLRGTITRSEQALSPGDPLTRALRQALAGVTGDMTAR